MTEHITVTVAAPGQLTVLTGRGDIDVAVSGELRDAGLSALTDPRCQHLLVDLTHVTLLDCSAIGALVELRNAATALSRELELFAPQPQVLKVLRLTGLDDVFTITGHSASRLSPTPTNNITSPSTP